jgi:lactose/L-arabinose transport system substrate-binding protein
MKRISTFLAAVAAVGLVSGGALAADPPKGEITVWSWNIAAEALDMLVPDFNKKYPDVKVHVVNMGHGDVVNKALAGCAAGGTDLPDVVTIENTEAEVYWARFPDCFANLKGFGVDKDRGQDRYHQSRRRRRLVPHARQSAWLLLFQRRR